MHWICDDNRFRRAGLPLLGNSIVCRILRLAIIVLALGFVFWITGCMERVFYHPTGEATPIPSELHQAGAEAVNFKSADGTALHGWFVPARAEGRRAASGLRAP